MYNLQIDRSIFEDNDNECPAIKLLYRSETGCKILDHQVIIEGLNIGNEPVLLNLLIDTTATSIGMTQAETDSVTGTGMLSILGQTTSRIPNTYPALCILL